MKKNLALTIVLYISIAGLLFSGYLSYRELFQKVCPLSGECTNVLGLPACVYGFIMYAFIFLFSLRGLKSNK